MTDYTYTVPLTLGYDSQARKDTPLLATVFGYFAAAMAGIARHCVRSNAKHNPGESVHWARGKSMDHGECIIRHSVDIEEMKAWVRRNPDHPQRAEVLDMLETEYDARAWRACADSQEFYEEFRGVPLAFNARKHEAQPGERVTPTGIRPPLIDYSHELFSDCIPGRNRHKPHTGECDRALIGPAGADWREP